MLGFPSDLSHWQPMRHHEPDEPLNARVRQYGQRYDREALTDPNNGDRVKIGKDQPADFGDFPTWGHWKGTKERSDETQPDGSELGAWFQAMPSVVAGNQKVSALATMSRPDRELQPKSLVQARGETARHAASVARKRGFSELVRDKIYPLWPEGDLYERRLPAGTPGISVTATYPDEQVTLFMPSALGALVADHRSEAPDLYSSVVYDVVGDELSLRYRARLSTVFRVAMPGPTMGAQPGLALVATHTPSGPGFLTAWFNGSYPPSEADDDVFTGEDADDAEANGALGGGFQQHDTPADTPVAGVGVYSTISWERGGTTHPGAGAADKHLHGFDPDGTPWTGAHTDTNSNFYMNVRMDAPLDFEPAFHPICAEGLFPYQVHLRYDILSRHTWQGRILEGLWRWHVKIPIGQPFRKKEPKDPGPPPTEPGPPAIIEPPWTGDPPGGGPPGGPPGSPTGGPPAVIIPAMSWVPFEEPTGLPPSTGRYPEGGPSGTFANPDSQTAGLGDATVGSGNWAEDQLERARQDIQRRNEERLKRREDREARELAKREARIARDKQKREKHGNWAKEREDKARADIARRENEVSPGAAKRAADARRFAEYKRRQEDARAAREAARLAVEEKVRAAIAERKAATAAKVNARKQARMGTVIAGGAGMQGSVLPDMPWPDDYGTVQRVRTRPADVALREGEHVRPAQLPNEVATPSIYGMAVPTQAGTPAWDRFAEDTGHGFLAAPLTAHLQAFGTEHAATGWDYVERPSWAGGAGPLVSGMANGGFAFLPPDRQVDDFDPWLASSCTSTLLFHPSTELGFGSWSPTRGKVLTTSAVKAAVIKYSTDLDGSGTAGWVLNARNTDGEDSDKAFAIALRGPAFFIPLDESDVTTPLEGMLAYNSVTSSFRYYTGAAWSSLGGGSGSINTASNVGLGQGIFKQVSGDDLEFYTISGATVTNISIAVAAPSSDIINISGALVWPLNAPDNAFPAQYTFDGTATVGSDQAGMYFDQDLAEGPAFSDITGTVRMQVHTTGVNVPDDLYVGGKLTVAGLIDPTGLELAPVAANPGGVAANTLWLDSTSSDRLKWGADLLIKGSLGLSDNVVPRSNGTGLNSAQPSEIYISDVAATLVTMGVLTTSDPIGTTWVLLGAASSDILGAGGHVVIRGGSGNASNGEVRIGDSGTSRVELGASGVPVEFVSTVLEIGHANDTTLSRKSAGVLQVQTSELYMQGGTDVAIADGGTGASSVDAAVQNLTNGATGRTPVLTDEIPFFDVGTAGGKTTPQALWDLGNSLTAKTSLVDADKLFLIDSAASNVAKNITYANLKLALMEGYTVIVKSANQDVTNSGLTNDSEFSFSVVAGGHYAIDMDLYLSGNDTTGDYTMDFTVSAGTQRGKGTCQNLTAAAAVQNIIVTAAAAASTTAIVTGAPTANLDDLVAVRVCYAFTASSNGTLNFRFGNSAPLAGRTSRTWKGSVFRHKRLD